MALGCDRRLKPTWVREGNDEIEALSVDIFVESMKIRCCVAYGCQEGDLVYRKNQFWKYLDEEVQFAINNNAGLVIQLDGNLWAGQNLIPGDPRPQNRNGKLLENFLKRHPHLSIANSSQRVCRRVWRRVWRHVIRRFQIALKSPRCF